jgi:hypothetical protein
MKEDKKTDLDQLIDDFNKKTAKQLEEILSMINTINSELRGSSQIKEAINCTE